ncbi:DUF4430 domain-containing protein [Aminipila butyrica]|uniref:DUF4430 domain-containing protein n=1 Tax=Aminipila butyrica TaxID=433296 RepID=A0A858BXM0_9FIRM|nr:DUF4430 domain-containing protein [Aminipila butyrica]QIB69650.1 DUF4430 domain-containing protein [Aminipila butyrica]
MKLTKGKLIAAGVICGALVITYVAGGGYAVKDSTPLSATNSVTDSAVAAVSSQEDFLTATGGAVVENPKDSEAKDGSGKSSADGQEKGTMTAAQKVALAQSMGSDASSAGVKKGSSDYSQSKGMSLDPETGKDKYLTEPVPEGKPVPVEPQNTVISDKKLTCTLSVRCDTILDNISALDPEKVELVPTSGAILATATVTFYEGESVFNVLQREMKKNKIHMEFVNTPLYNSAYIEGINNLYEFDCGELSGWMYKVNDWFPNYGCSRYQLKQGDVIEWVYTCDLGRDVGGYYSTGG